MKTNNHFLIFTILLLLTSCFEDNSLEGNLPYFQFQNEDKANLLNLPELNSRLTFINQDKEELYFDVVKSESEKKLYERGNWVTPTTKKFFYYDEQEIYLRSTLYDIDNEYEYFEISLKRYPKTFNDGSNGKEVEISGESALIARIDFNPFSNKGDRITFAYKNTFQMNFLQHQYNKVTKIDLTKTESYGPKAPLPSLYYIYFDINKGLIGFDDRNGKEWRLK